MRYFSMKSCFLHLTLGMLLSFCPGFFRISAADIPRPPAEPRTVCIDPGHPSEVGIGTRGKRITEVGVCWQVALKLKTLLEQQGMKVLLTKQRERETVTNRRRAEIANRARADLLLRLHCDYAPNETGTATFFPDRAGKIGKKRGPSASVIQASRACAAKFHPAMMAHLEGKLSDRGVHPDTHTAIGGKQGALTGSIYARVPVLLVEMAVLNHPQDEDFLAGEAGQKQMAEALARGITAALKEKRK